MRFRVIDTYINCTKISLHICSCFKGCPPMLQALRGQQKKTRFCSKLVACILWRLTCGQDLHQFVTHCCLQQAHAESALSVLRARAKSQATACPTTPIKVFLTWKNIAYVTLHHNIECLECFMDGLPAMDIFSKLACP